MITKYMSKKMLEKALGNTDYSIPSFMVGLSSTPITVDGIGATEPIGKGYARKLVANNRTEWSTMAADGYVSNLQEIRMDRTTADCGAISWVFVADTTSNILFAKALDRVLNLEQATIVVFEPGDLKFKLN